ncbi:alpha/beta fold hydrolase [Amycolatopsis acidicola]|uniref:Alpha/beta fold hydrolase n=1 Tax=Amycolatopsis acidicola TaxID=2596893 RepID=A0A5N0USQ5_9PSEU|nr:alpha/beta fold hydrolase [Amycolatopsis acidicola]KAA9154069.1 alpha/beta fold hydrolase [Amycolatopsis acidicola]
MRRLAAVLAVLLTTLLIGPPAGAAPAVNDWSCHPSAAHPDPVVLVHGTGDNKDYTWRLLGPLLVQKGFCTYSLTYGVPADAPASADPVGGLTSMDSSAAELRSFVDKVTSASGAAKVDLVGYSQGTWLGTYYAKLLDGKDKIGRYVSLAPGWQGTDPYGLAELYDLLKGLGLGSIAQAASCAVCPELLKGSDLLTKLQAGGVFLPGITYTNIVSKEDGLVVPWTSGLGHGPNVTNVVLQDACEADHVNHSGMPFDPNALGYVVNALDPADARPVACVPMSPMPPHR